MALRRFRVAEHSMVPALSPGEEIVASDSRLPSVGDIVVFPHPDRDEFWLVKRVAKPETPIPAGHFWALSDAPENGGVDSRVLGPIPLDGSLTMVDRLDETVFGEACMMLAAEDEALRGLVDGHGIPPMWSRSPGFRNLALLIVEQQVSLESAAAVFGRVLEAAGGPLTPEKTISLGLSGLMSTGVTGQKAGYLVGLAESLLSGAIDLDNLGQIGVDQARAALLAIRGIGPWTADAYLLACLGHLDVFPVGDRALQVGAGEALGMARPPDPEELAILAEGWRPVRSVAARLIWHSYLQKRGRSEPLVRDPYL
jgi:DNA-3-methyladenine glycosylase II